MTALEQAHLAQLKLFNELVEKTVELTLALADAHVCGGNCTFPKCEVKKTLAEGMAIVDRWQKSRE